MLKTTYPTEGTVMTRLENGLKKENIFFKLGGCGAMKGK